MYLILLSAYLEILQNFWFDNFIRMDPVKVPLLLCWSKSSRLANMFLIH